jgi:hypothetical protein
MKRRVEAGQPALSGMFTRAEVTYAWPRPDGTVGSDREPVALFTGEAVHAYLGHLSDETIEAMLNELSIELGAALGQERIYVAFADRTWILDAGERRKTSWFADEPLKRDGRGQGSPYDIVDFYAGDHLPCRHSWSVPASASGRWQEFSREPAGSFSIAELFFWSPAVGSDARDSVIRDPEFPDTCKKFPVPWNIFPVNLRRELGEKWLQRSGFLLQNRSTRDIFTITAPRPVCARPERARSSGTHRIPRPDRW